MRKYQIACFLAFAVSGTARAQDCSQFLLLQKDKTVEITNYDKKGQPNGKQVYTVKDVSSSGGTVTGTVNSEQFDKNSNSKAKASSTIQCSGGEFRLDMKLMLPQQQAEKYGDAEVNAKSSFLSYPGTMKVGDAPPDGSFTMDLSHSGGGPGGPGAPGAPPAGPPGPPGFKQSLTMTISDRKVIAQESVTTTAGTWNCFKITYRCKVGVKTGPFSIPTNIDITEWYAPGFGVIKTESKYGSTAITSIK
jgi:hypothetical protein